MKEAGKGNLPCKLLFCFLRQMANNRGTMKSDACSGMDTRITTLENAGDGGGIEVLNGTLNNGGQYGITLDQFNRFIGGVVTMIVNSNFADLISLTAMHYNAGDFCALCGYRIVTTGGFVRLGGAGFTAYFYKE